MQRLVPARCAVVVVDVQHKLAAAMPAVQMSELLRAATVMLGRASCWGAAIYTEQYPAAWADGCPGGAARRGGSAGGEGRLRRATSVSRALAATSAKTAIVLGMETHVCVFQTVREMRARGLEVHVPVDGVASRRDDHRAAGLALCREAGATLTTMETVVFDWLRRAGSSEFKALSKLIR
ncbi:MAG: isochorismatase family protein [Polyangiaceae bacterium]